MQSLVQVTSRRLELYYCKTDSSHKQKGISVLLTARVLILDRIEQRRHVISFTFALVKVSNTLRSTSGRARRIKAMSKYTGAEGQAVCIAWLRTVLEAGEGLFTPRHSNLTPCGQQRAKFNAVYRTNGRAHYVKRWFPGPLIIMRRNSLRGKQAVTLRHAAQCALFLNASYRTVHSPRFLLTSTIKFNAREVAHIRSVQIISGTKDLHGQCHMTHVSFKLSTTTTCTKAYKYSRNHG